MGSAVTSGSCQCASACARRHAQATTPLLAEMPVHVVAARLGQAG